MGEGVVPGLGASVALIERLTGVLIDSDVPLDREHLRAAVKRLAAAEAPLAGRALFDQVIDGLVGLGTRLATDPELRAKVEGWLGDAAGYVVRHYRAEITTLITDTVERWDAEETSRKIELQVGRDLQFIRINGTVVGSLAGLVIYAVGQLAFGG